MVGARILFVRKKTIVTMASTCGLILRRYADLILHMYVKRGVGKCQNKSLPRAKGIAKLNFKYFFCSFKE